MHIFMISLFVVSSFLLTAFLGASGVKFFFSFCSKFCFPYCSRILQKMEKLSTGFVLMDLFLPCSH